MNHKRVQRICRDEGLKVPQKQPKRGRLASILTYAAAGGIITGTPNDTAFTDATWSITVPADPTNIVSGTGDSPAARPAATNFLSLVPLRPSSA